MGEFLGWGKTIQRLFSSHSLCGFSAFDKTTFSGRDLIRTPTRLHPQSSSVPLRTWSSRLLKVCQLLTIQHSNLIIFSRTLSITIQSINWACSKSSRHAQSYTSMVLWHTHLSIVRLNSLVHWTTVTALLGSHLLRWHIAGQAWWLRRYISQCECFLVMRRCRRANALPLAVL